MIDQACPEWRGDLAAYLIGALDHQARTAFRHHLASCLACRAEYDELFPVVCRLAHLAAVAEG